MPNSKLPPFLTSLIASLGNATVVPLEIREGESVEAAIRRYHDENCEDCKAKIKASAGTTDTDAAAGTDAAKSTDRGVKDEMKEKLLAKHDDERREMAERHEKERAILAAHEPGNRYEGMRPEMAAPYGNSEKAAPTRQPIGFMAFHVSEDGTARAIPQSFNEDSVAVEKLVEMVEGHPIALLLAAVSGSTTEVRPVYGE